MTVDPPTGLVGGQTVSVHGQGFAPGQTVNVSQCAPATPFCTLTGTQPTADGSGAFTVEFLVSLRVLDVDGQPSDCLVETCVLAAIGYPGLEQVAVARLDFDPGQPPPADPAITVTPADGLRDGQLVEVHGTGFEAGGDLELTQCPASDPGSCLDSIGYLPVPADGTFTTTVPVSRLVGAFGLTGIDVADCVTVGCSIAAHEYLLNGFSLSAVAPITFDDSVPPPPVPTVEAAPTTDLPYRATVTVTGSGFAPGEEIDASRCVEALQFGSLLGRLHRSGRGRRQRRRLVPDHGEAHHERSDRSGRLHRRGPSSARCRSHGQRSYEEYTFPLTFDPNAPIPPPPVITVTPDTNLDYRQDVHITGTGFAPSGPVLVEQCALPSSPGDLATCSSSLQVTADAVGGIDSSFPATRVVFGFFQDSIDCTDAAVSCVIHAVDADEFDFGFGLPPLPGAIAPVTFDPTSTPPPPPVVTVTPAVGLADGQAVTVAGSGFVAPSRRSGSPSVSRGRCPTETARSATR